MPQNRSSKKQPLSNRSSRNDLRTIIPWKNSLSQTPGNLTHDLFISPDERKNSVICAKLQKSVAQPRRIISKNTPFPTSLKDNFLPFSPFSCTERDKMCKEHAFICPNICLEEEIFIPLQRNINIFTLFINFKI